MRKLAFILLFLFLSGCSAVQFNPPPLPASIPAAAATATPVLVPDLSTATPIPSPVPPTETLTPTETATLAPVEIPNFEQFTMLDTQNGWGWVWSEKPALYHTSDGGLSWELLSLPENGTFSGWSNHFFDGKTAWLSGFDSQGGQKLSYTGDGGKTWQARSATGLENLGGLPSYTFFDASHGFAEVAGVGAGNLYIQLYETLDGGNNFQLVPMISPNGENSLPPGTIHLCSICNDVFYFDLARLVVVKGDMGSMQPSGAINLLVSFDHGMSWQPQNLPLPPENVTDLAAPLTPKFFGANDGLLPVKLLNYGPDGAPTTDLLLIYITRDGGKTWQISPTRIEKAARFPGPQFFDANQGIVQCGESICVTTDGAQTWQTVTSNLALPNTETSYIRQLTFADTRHGWLVISDNQVQRYYRTTDGGQNWVLLNP